MANSPVYNGTDLGQYGMVLLASDIQLLPQPNYVAQRVIGAFGGVGSTNGYGERRIVANVAVFAQSAQDLQSKLDSIKYVLATTEKALWLHTQPDRYYICSLSSSIETPDPLANSAEFSLTFTAADSLAYGLTARTSPDFTVSATPQTITTETIPGDSTVLPVWVIKNTSGSTVTSLTFASTTTGETFTWNGSLANGSWMRVTAYPNGAGYVEVSANSGSTWTSSMLGVSTGPIFPTLTPKVANSLTLTGLSSGTVTLTYTPRYL